MKDQLDEPHKIIVKFRSEHTSLSAKFLEEIREKIQEYYVNLQKLNEDLK